MYKNFILFIFLMGLFYPQLLWAESTTTKVDQNILSQMQIDFTAALNGGVIPNIGDSMPWAGGTLTRTAKGEMKYVNSTNGYYEKTLNTSTDLTQFAREDGMVNKAWISQYGVDLGNNLGSSPSSADQAKGNLNAVTHCAQYGVSSQFTQSKPFDIGFGIGAFNDNGQTKFVLNGKVYKYDELVKTNEYKALVGANVTYAEPLPTPSTTTQDKSTPVNNKVGNDNLNYITKYRESAIDMLIEATKKYKAGTLSKEDYISIAVSVGDASDYHKKTVVKPQSELCKKLPKYAGIGVAGVSETHEQLIDNLNRDRCAAGYDPLPGYIGDKRTKEQQTQDEVNRRNEIKGNLGK